MISPAQPTDVAAAGRASEPRTGWRRGFGAELRAQAPLLVVAAVYCLAGVAVQSTARIPAMMQNVAFWPLYRLYALTVLSTAPLAFVWRRMLVRDAQGRWISGLAGWRAAWSSPGSAFLTPARAGGLVTAALLMPFLLNTYGSWKLAMPTLSPFEWDHAFSELDRRLHFGAFPWTILQPALGRPTTTRMVDWLYVLWLTLNPIVIIWQGWSTRTALRDQFFMAYALAYMLLGTGMALALSSAGPCYYAAVTGGPSAYAPLFQYLRQVHDGGTLIAIQAQDALWRNFVEQANRPFQGISAMPSMHVAVAVLFALLGWRTHRLVGILFGVYAGIVLIGSVHLGWHYAIDGYAAAAGAVLVWKLAGHVVSACPALPRARRAP